MIRRHTFEDGVRLTRARLTAGAVVILALAVAAPPMLAQQPGDSTEACRIAVHYQRPTPDDSVAIFDREAALRCAGLAPGTDTLAILSALAAHGGNRDLIAYYALVIANRHFRAARQTPERPELERALRSVRLAHGIQPSRTTGFLLGLAAATLAFALQEGDDCNDVARATSLLAEARAVYPVDSVVLEPHGPPDWDAVERKAKERVAQVCGRPSAQPPPAGRRSPR